MKTLIILNDPPYGTERTYNGLRLAANMLKMDEQEPEMVVFLMGDAVSSAKKGQKTPNGYYNLERMIELVLKRGAEVWLCGTCMDARGIGEDEVVQGARRSTLDALTQATLEAQKVLVF
ncbi:MAG TPA: DsrE family protein [Polyangiaceae bacterium]|jgi:uncharacterized protein involved in oxidation of intracellular sulfur|nr:MAG: DsrE/DsrF-like family protein [Deltaproteobacteria bacterium ADurb.Bin207]HNZ24707.1 DsrE family protein [Polyangiaceae bacterium]HOD24610.1 DsrE family protein [Polyangiaceae bacterium]HOE50735.1 DsrE family protein [Polyangiaceae bacterium]HOH03461.1 DsrE family protein [Polyangiaceae bacterium]